MYWHEWENKAMFTAKSRSSSVVNVFHRLFLGMSGVLFFMIQSFALGVDDITQPSRTPVLFFYIKLDVGVSYSAS